MAKKLNSVVGIDIGSRSIKVAELRSQGRDVAVTALGITQTPADSVDHTGIYTSDAVGSALKALLNESGVSASHAVVSIAGQASVMVRTLEVPKMNPSELKEQMQWEINRNMPFSESNFVSDYRPLGDDDPNSQNMDVVMAISPQSAIDTVLACMKKAGKQVAAIDVEPMGFARSLVRSYDDVYAGKTICVVDLGHKTTSINIYRNGKLLMPRQVPIGGEMFDKEIANALGVSVADAESAKFSQVDLTKLEVPVVGAVPDFGAPTQGFTPYNPFSNEPVGPGASAEAPGEPEPPVSAAPVPSQASPATTALASAVEEFVGEVRRSVDYFRSRGGNVDVIVLAGGGAKLKGLDDYLRRSLGMECDNYDPLRRLNVNARKVAPDFVDQHRQEFAVAVGNGLHIFFD
ncbi:MAG: type IV pilus assembly protein PilM [Fimbriimonadaceae bacterium]